MNVSVILCTYSMDRYTEFQQAAESILGQTYDKTELVIVIDGTEEVYDRVSADYGNYTQTIIHCNEQNRGLSFSRNAGVELATGDVVAFIDDDAVAAPDWIERIADAYERHNATAVGGQMVPDWLSEKPEYLPEEYYFLIGVTYRGFRETEGYVRNTFSSNLSFNKDVFTKLGGFKIGMGKQGENDLQGGETELCARLERETGERVMYVPDATVKHKIYQYRTERKWLLERAFWQGYSKRRIAESDPDATDTEREFLQELIFSFLPRRIRNFVRFPSLTKLDRLFMLMIFTFVTGIGFLYAAKPEKI